MARWLVNPRRGRTNEHRPRVSRSGQTFHLGARSPYKGVIRRINPYLMEYTPLWGNPRRSMMARRHRRHRNPTFGLAGLLGSNPRHHRRGRRHARRNPDGIGATLTRTLTNPLDVLQEGSVGLLGAWFTVVLPNALLPFPGADLMSRVLRFLTRVGAGALVVSGTRMILPRSVQAARVGAAIAVGGGTLFDLLGTSFTLGAGDTAQRALLPIGFGAYLPTPRGLGSTGAPGLSAYLPTPRGLAAAYPARSRRQPLLMAQALTG